MRINPWSTRFALRLDFTLLVIIDRSNPKNQNYIFTWHPNK